MTGTRPSTWAAWAVLAALLAAPSAQAQRPDGDDFFLLRKNLEIFGEAYATLTEEYADPLDPQRIVRDGLGAVLGNLDPYTVLLDEATLAQGALLRSTYGQVGVTIEQRGEALVVGVPDEGTPTGGYAQGLRVGDRVVEIAGRDARALPITEAATLLSGEPGTTVTIAVERPGQSEPIEFVLTREDPAPVSVPFSGFIGADTTRGMGYVRLSVFGTNAAQETRSAINSLRDDGLDGLVLDLRGNGGGLLGAAVEIVGMMVPTGTNVTTLRMRDPSQTQAYRTSEPPVVPNVPVVVLVDSLSASASEIVAGALQDLDRAVVIGDETFGKGLVQVVRRLPYNTALKLTVGRYELPSGRVVQRLDYQQGGVGDAVGQTVGFTTRAGRPVSGGSGVRPDVPGATPPPSALEAALLRGAWFFRFADAFEERTETLQPGWQDDLLPDFRVFLEREGFDYESDAGDALAELRARLQAAGYSDALGATDRLDQALAQDQQRDFDRHADALVRRLVQTIRPRYVLSPAPLLETDPTLQQALDLLADPDAYARLLAR
jgi:carboxyl-terminal processing protease